MIHLGVFTLALLSALPAPAQEASPAQLLVEDGEAVFRWGEHVVARDLEMRLKREVVPFDAARVQLVAEGDGFRFVPTSEEDQDLVIRGLFSLSYNARAVSLQEGETDVLQWAIGHQASDLCDTLIDAETSMAFTAPGCLRLRDWDEGGMAEVRFRLADQPLVRLRKLEQLEDRAQASVREYVEKHFVSKTKKKTLAELPDLAQLLTQDLPSDLNRHAIQPLRQAKQDAPLLLNVRVAAIPNRPGFDMLVLFNPTDAPVSREVQLEELGWQQASRKRLVAFADGTFLPEESTGTVKLTAAAGSWQIAYLRPISPVSAMCSSAGPLGQVIHSWIWESISSAPSGEPEFTVRWKWHRSVPGEAWVLLVLPQLQGRLMRVEHVTIEGGEQPYEAVFEQSNIFLHVRLRDVEEDQKPILAIKFDGWLDG